TIKGCGFSGNLTPNAGGGIYNAGTLLVTNSGFSGNGSVGADGGAVYNAGTATMNTNSFTGNGGPEAYGGAIRNDGSMTLDVPMYVNYEIPSEFSQNVAALGRDIYNTGTLAIDRRIRQLDLYNFGGFLGGVSGQTFMNYGTLTLVNCS